MSASADQPRQTAADAIGVELFHRQFWARVVALPNSGDLASTHRARERVRRVAVVEELVRRGDSGAAVDAFVDRSHPLRVSCAASSARVRC